VIAKQIVHQTIHDIQNNVTKARKEDCTTISTPSNTAIHSVNNNIVAIARQKTIHDKKQIRKYLKYVMSDLSDEKLLLQIK